MPSDAAMFPGEAASSASGSPGTRTRTRTRMGHDGGSNSSRGGGVGGLPRPESIARHVVVRVPDMSVVSAGGS